MQTKPIEFYITNIYVKPVFFSNMQQEMAFQIGSTLPVKSSKIAILSYISRAEHWAVEYFLNSRLQYLMKTCSFDNSISYVKQEIDFQLSSKSQ